MTDAVLLPHHADLIAASAIAPDVATERGYYSATVKARLLDLGFSALQARVPALVIPLHGTRGGIVGYQIRPDEPREDKRGKVVKYETPAKWRMRLDVHPRSRAALANPKVPLVVTEGARKGDAAVSNGLCVVALLGVWNWRGTNDDGGKVALPDWNDVALNGRKVYLAFDSDAWEKPDVYRALTDLRAYLS